MCEMPSAYVCDKPKARKEHRCCECRGFIRVGENYVKHHGIWDGSPAAYKVCEDCESLRAEVDKDIFHREDATAFGELYETVFESRELNWINRFMATKRKRWADIPAWMLKRETEAREESKPEAAKAVSQ